MVDQQSLKGLRALVIEDEYFIADDLKGVLKRHGAHLVRLSGSIEHAMDQGESTVFDFALIDINIRGETTFALADMLRRRNVSFAFVSGYGRSVIPRRFDDVPNWGKPYDDRQIVAGIQALWTRPIAPR